MKFSFLIVPLIGSLLMLSSCKTAYQAQSFTGGFTDTQIGENIWRVNVRSNAFTSRGDVSDIILLRSADLTLQNGFKYFAFAAASTGSETVAINNPGTTYTSGTANLYGNSGSFNATSQTYGGGTTFLKKPSAENTVVMFKEKPKTHKGFSLYCQIHLQFVS